MEDKKKQTTPQFPCAETGVCQCITAEDLKKTNRKINKIQKDVDEIRSGHDCVQRDRVNQLEIRQDQKFEKVMDKLEAQSLKLQEVIDRLEKKKEQNGHTRDEVAHIHQEESDLSKEIGIIKEKMGDHEKIMKSIEGINERLIKQEERQQALINSIKDREEEESKLSGEKRNKKQMLFQTILVVSTIISIAWVIFKDVLHW